MRDALERREVVRDRLRRLDRTVRWIRNSDSQHGKRRRPNLTRLCQSWLGGRASQYLPAELPLPQALRASACACVVCGDGLSAVFIDAIFKFKHVRRAAGEATLVAHEMLVPAEIIAHFDGDDEVF